MSSAFSLARITQFPQRGICFYTRIAPCSATMLGPERIRTSIPSTGFAGRHFPTKQPHTPPS
eukprot:1843548-Rhodomonas_salina.2